MNWPNLWTAFLVQFAAVFFHISYQHESGNAPLLVRIGIGIGGVGLTYLAVQRLTRGRS
jgi:hypothetical protein